MHAAFLLAGLATMLLGPILPLLSRQWHLQDSQAGLLLLAQFTGATLGGATVSKRLPQAFLLGLTAACAGFLLFAVAPNLIIACLGLLLGGFGVGRIIASVNIIAGSRFTHQRGSALARLNLSFSLGCLLSPLLAAQLAPRFTLPHLLTGFAALFLCVALPLRFELRRPAQTEAEADPAIDGPILTNIFLLFAAILFLYGGLETCLSGWLTTYALRYGQTSLVLSQYTFVLLLCGLIAGRAFSAWLLTRIREATLLRIALGLTILSAAGLATATRAPVIATLAVALGVCLAPVFPASFALYMATKPSARQAGLVLAASGLGAAAIPWLMGVVSTHTGSLRLALTLPVATAVTLLLLSAVLRTRATPATATRDRSPA
jgi:FHS family glucose/mannose:H+ symporter-like MFS transporter